MATQFDAIPDVQFDVVPDVEFDAIPDEVVTAEAQRAATGAVQALDVMSAPRALDWSEANEKLDADRFYESESLRAQAALDPQQAAGLLAKSREMRQGITPYTETGQRLNQQERAEQQGRVDVATTAARGSTPSEAIGGLMGPVFEANVMPIVDSAARNAGAAAGGAIGAARFIPHPGTQLAAQFLLPMAGALMGAQAGGNAQEAVLRGTETDEETANRQRIAAEDFERNPGLSRIGAAAANFPFFRPGLAQFGRAASGDRGAILNLGLAGTIGGGMEVAAAMVRGETAKAEDIAAGVFSNLIMNEPTRLGRRLGLQPSTEQAAVEAAEAKYGGRVPPLAAPELESGLANRGTTSTADVFAGVQRVPAAETLPIPIGEQASSPEAAIQAEAQKAGPVIYDGVTQMGDDGFYNFSDTTSKPGTRISFTVESTSAPTAEQIQESYTAALERFGVKAASEPPPVEPTPAPEEVPAPEAPPTPAPEPVPVTEATAASEASLPADPNATSNKEAVVNAERAARELDPVIKEARISNADSIDRAQQVITENPLKPQEIITRLRENPQERTISLEDSAVLLVERTRLNKTREELLNRANDESLDPTTRATAKSEFETIETRLNELDQAAQDARSTWGRFGQLWQRSMRQDFSLAALESRARLKKGEALTAEESAQVKTLADEVAAEQVKADAAIEAAQVRQTEKAVDDAITSSAKQPDAEPAVKSLADRIIAKLDSQAESARKRLRERFKKVGSAPDPLIVADFAVMAATRIAKTAIKSGQWIVEMVKEFGEGARPYLQAAWNAADAKLDEMVNAGTGEKKKRATVKAKILSTGEQQDRVIAAMTARIKEGESIDGLGRYVDKLVDSFVKGGVRDRGALVAAVKGVLEPLSPGITDRKVGELISGYGQATLLSKDPLKVVKRDLKGQLQQVSKLEALAAKDPLRKTGPERRTASDEERRLVKEVNAAKKAAGVVTTDPATQLKSTMDAARTRFANEIKDLSFEIETGTRPPTRTPVEYDADIQVMRGIRDRLRQTVRDLKGLREITDEQRIRITTRGLLDSIAALESRIAGAQPKTRRAAPDTPEIRVLKAKRDALRADLNEINAADSLLQENRKAEALVRSIEQAEATLAGTASRPAPPQGPESQLVAEAREQLAAVREQIRAKNDADPAVQQERMDAAEAAVEKAIKKLDEQIQAGDISVQRAPSPAGSQRLEDLRLQRDAMNRLRNQLRIEARPKPNALDVAIKARKSALKRQEADYEARIAAKDFGPRTRKPPVDLSSDPAALDALARVQAVKDKFAKLQKQWQLDQRTKAEKVLAGIGHAWDALRNLKLSEDFSAFIQVAPAAWAHPVEAGKALIKGLRAAAEQLTRNSDNFARREEQRIANSPNAKNGLYKEMKLDLSDITGEKREENAGSVLEKLADLEARWEDLPNAVKGLFRMEGKPLVKGAKTIAKAIPKFIGMNIKASNAAFGAIANHMRAATADAVLARQFRRRGAPTKQQLELLGNGINAMTGKGGLNSQAMNRVFFAPNYYLAKFKNMFFQPEFMAAIKGEGGIVRELLEERVRGTLTLMALGTLQYLFGNRDKQTLDPRDPRFGKAVTDRGTTIDTTMGFGPYVTLAAQWWTGETIDKKGRVQKQDRGTSFLNFLKGRLSREISTGLTTAFGNDFKGKPLDAAGLAKALVAPLAWQDIDKVLAREGMTRGSFLQILNLLGASYRVAD